MDPSLIPSALQYGALGLLALVLLGIGFVAYRLMGKVIPILAKAFDRQTSAIERAANSLERMEAVGAERHKELLKDGSTTRRVMRAALNGAAPPADDEEDGAHGH